MKGLPWLQPILERQIAILGDSAARLSLMSVATVDVPTAKLQPAVRSAANPLDLVGLLADGSVGVASLRSIGPDGGAAVEERFLPRLRVRLQVLCDRQALHPPRIWFRSVHRWASELSGAVDLMDTLFDTPARPIGLGIASGSEIAAPSMKAAAGYPAPWPMVRPTLFGFRT